MSIALSTGISAVALAILSHNPELHQDWRAACGLASACCCAGCVAAGAVVAFVG